MNKKKKKFLNPKLNLHSLIKLIIIIINNCLVRKIEIKREFFFFFLGRRFTVHRRIQWTQIQIVLVQRGFRTAGHARGRVPIFGHQKAHRNGGRRFQHHVLLLRTDGER